jgi:hypothetical protein
MESSTCSNDTAVREAGETSSLFSRQRLQKCEKGKLNFVMSVRPQGTTRLPLKGFYEI